jgi:hypothetical protein
MKSLLLVHISHLHSSHTACRVADSSTIGHAQTASDMPFEPIEIVREVESRLLPSLVDGLRALQKLSIRPCMSRYRPVN